MDNETEELKQIIKDLKEDKRKMKQELKELKTKYKPPTKPPTFRTKIYTLSSELYDFIEKQMNNKMKRTEIDPLTGFEKTRTFQYMNIIKIIMDYTKNHFETENQQSSLHRSLKYDPDLYSLMKIDETEKIKWIGNQSYIFKKLEENGHIVSVEYF